MGRKANKINNLRSLGTNLETFAVLWAGNFDILKPIRKNGTPVWGSTGGYIEIHTGGRL